jgi:hypothetical protein
MHTSRLIPLVAVLCAAAACNLDQNDGPSNPPKLQVVNAAAHSTAMSLFLDQSPQSIAGPLVPRAIHGTCPFVLNGSHLFEFVQHDTLFAEVEGR